MKCGEKFFSEDRYSMQALAKWAPSKVGVPTS